MDEHRRFGSDQDASAFEENVELLRRETAEEMLAQSQKRSAKQGSGNKKADPAKSNASKTKSEAVNVDKSKNKGSKSGKSAVKQSKNDKGNADLSENNKKSGSLQASGKAEKSTAAKNKSKVEGSSKNKKKDASAADTEETSGKIRGKKSISERLASELVDVKPYSARKRTAKKPVQTEEEPPAEQPDNQTDDGANRTSCKTPQVMKLIEDDSDELVIYAGKSRVPRLLRGRESLSRLSKRSIEENETEVVNITDLVIRHEAADILDRFNACSCEKCVEVFSEMIAQRIPVRYARISRSELELDELPERAVPMRKVVLPEMIRELICNKKRSFHDK